MDLFPIAATFAAAIPVAFAAALFMRCVPAMFVAFMDRSDRTWPRGVQEEDPEAAWASRVPLPGPVRAARPARRC